MEILATWDELLTEADLEQRAMAVLSRHVRERQEAEKRPPAFVINAPISRNLAAIRAEMELAPSNAGLYEAMLELPTRQYNVMVLRYVLNYPVARIARYMGLARAPWTTTSARDANACASCWTCLPRTGTAVRRPPRSRRTPRRRGGMMRTLDDMLAEAAMPVRTPTRFDVGAALRKLAVDAGRDQAKTTMDARRAAQAGQRLTVIARRMLNAPHAAHHVDRLAQGGPDVPVEEDNLDVEGAAVFASLLYLTGQHPKSAQFWWQLAAGAGHRASAYCLHLHHTALGEQREAAHWLHQVLYDLGDKLDDGFFDAVEAIARYVYPRPDGASPLTGGLEMEVDRLADHGSPCVIVPRPDRRLARVLREHTRA
ncbi:hypothetical protein [Streptomyces huasconensis]|uniref:hypothetical protein n=1 Tax=Streptomyces huasconensis TaxID=1854574 RepID=UPI0033F17D12